MLFSLFLACADPEPEDSNVEEKETTEPDDDGGCDVVEIHYDGPDAPVVGDTWTVLLWCDDALLLGASVIQIEPTEAATITENTLTFLVAGEATVHMQVGRMEADLPVTVTEAGATE